jgi:hypothetical protein
MIFFMLALYEYLCIRKVCSIGISKSIRKYPKSGTLSEPIILDKGYQTVLCFPVYGVRLRL